MPTHKPHSTPGLKIAYPIPFFKTHGGKGELLLEPKRNKKQSAGSLRLGRFPRASGGRLACSERLPHALGLEGGGDAAHHLTADGWSGPTQKKPHIPHTGLLSHSTGLAGK